MSNGIAKNKIWLPVKLANRARYNHLIRFIWNSSDLM
jgi:hypothetical protein